MTARAFSDSDRNTPACAGKTKDGNLKEELAGKHPRMRGEDIRSETDPVQQSETPPHARGRLRRTGLLNGIHGNTPACAGKTTCKALKKMTEWKHPRMRGEDRKILCLFNDLPTKYGVLIQLRGDSCRYKPTPTMRRRVAGQSISERSVGRTGSGIPQAEGMSPSNLTPGLKSVKTRQVH